MASASGITFQEVMKGGFAPNVTDPRTGGHVGAQAGHVLSLHAIATIPDAARFVQDPQHQGELAGSVTFDVLGTGMPISHGVFQLFVPTSDPNLKLMVYRAIFEHAGAAYCLDGAKHVRRRSVLHSWTDTTTLHCRLHAGTDTSAPIVAAGILRLRALDFARQLFSFRTVKSPTFAAKAAALATFFTFFARELLDTYFRRARRTASRAEDVRS